MKIWFKFFFTAVLLNTAMFINTTDYDSDINIFQVKKTENAVNTSTLNSVDTITIETATSVTTNEIISNENSDTTEAEVISDSYSNNEITDSSPTNIILSTADTTNSEFVNTSTNVVQIISNTSTNAETTVLESSTTKTNELETNLNLPENNLFTTKENTNNELTNYETTNPESSTTKLNVLETNEENKTTMNYESESRETNATDINWFTNDGTLITENPESAISIIDSLTTNTKSNDTDTNEKAETLIDSSTNLEIQATYFENVTSKSIFNSSVDHEFLTATAATNSELNNRTINEDDEILLNSAINHEIQATLSENTTISKSIFNSSVDHALLTTTEATNSKLNGTNKDEIFQAPDSKHASQEVVLNLSTNSSTETSDNLNYATTEYSGTTEKLFGKYYSLLKEQTGFKVDPSESETTENPGLITDSPISSTETTTEEPNTTTEKPTEPTEEPTTTPEPNICLDKVQIEKLTIIPSSFSLYVAWSKPPPKYDECKFEYLIEWKATTESKNKNNYTILPEYTIDDLNACEDYEISVTVTYEESKNDPIIKTNSTTETMKAVVNLEYKQIGDHTLYISWILPPDVAKCFRNYRFKKYANNIATMNMDYYNNNITFYDVNGCINNTYEVITFSKNNLSKSDSIFYLEPKVNDPPIFNETTIEIEDDFVITKWSFGEYVCRPEKFYVQCNKEDDEVNIDGEFNIYHNELSAKLDNIDSYTVYTCYGIIVNMAGNSSCSKPGTFLTNPKQPDAPQKLNIVEKDNKYLSIMWEPPQKWNGKQEEYNISIEYIGLNYYLPKYCTPSYFEKIIQTLDAKETEYNFTKIIIPASKYKISVIAKSSGGWGKEIQRNIDLEDGIPDTPTVLKINWVRSTSVNFTWNTPCKIHGILKHYNIKLLGKKDNCEPHFMEEYYTPGPDENEYHEKIFQKLIPDYNYSLQLRAINQNHSGEAAEIFFYTPAGPPEAPQNVTIIEYANKYLNIQWEPPKKWNGIEKSYNVSVEYRGLNYKVSEECAPISVSPYSEILYATETELNFSTFIIPASNYRISVQAESDGGWGNELEDFFDLAEATPEKPLIYFSQLTSKFGKNYDTSLTIMWRAPCKMHGVLEAFHIKLSGERVNFEPDINEENIPPDDNNSYGKVFPDLKPDYNYTLEIQARNKNHFGLNAVKTYWTPAGIPNKPNVDNLKKPNASAASYPWKSAIVYIRNDMFDQSMGNIIYYAVIIATEFCSESPKYELFKADNWPRVSSDNTSCTNESKAYEATIQKWNPFAGKSLNEYPYTLGEDENCTILDHCNRPLQPDTKYYIKIRGFTRNGYSDTNLLSLLTEASPTDAVPVALIIGLIIGILAIAFIIAAVLFYTKGRINIKNWPRMESASQISPAPLPVPIKKFGAHYEKMIENPGKIKNEFQLLSTISSDVTLSTKTALLPVNKKKNRYINILPYDQTRVILQENANSSDYINASFIKGYSGSNEYIASQGPTEATCPAFWQMILEQNVKLIVMLTQFVESGKDKCYKYFPDLKEEYDLLNDIKIQCVEEEILNEYNKRIFKVIKGNTTKKVTHIQFNLWPDFGVPDEVHHMIDFCEIIKDIKLKKPSIIVMHCSAGVGRTGTLIAFDILLQTIRDKRKVDIFGTVLNLRKQRMTMVQSERQYEFLYKCVYYVINNNKPSMSKHNLNQITESNM